MNRQVLSHFLCEVKKGPSHLLYFLKNVHPIRDHLPNLYLSQLQRRQLDLGGPSELSKLHVIMRTTDSVMNLNSTRQLDDVGIVSKRDVIRVGGCSLFKAAQHFVAVYGRDKLRITIVGDCLSESGVQQYRDAANLSDVGFELVESKGHGNGPSFQTQIDIALSDGDDTLAFILEDDYLLDSQVLNTAFSLFCAHNSVAGYNPHFHPDRVRFQDIGPLAVFDRRLLCRVFSTCCTFFMPCRFIRQYEKSLRLYEGWEKGSIGNAWARSVCLAPLGWTHAEHLHLSDLSPVQRLVADH